jgi:hypothetical protein
MSDNHELQAKKQLFESLVKTIGDALEEFCESQTEENKRASVGTYRLLKNLAREIYDEEMIVSPKATITNV